MVFDRDGKLFRHTPYLCDPAQVEVLQTVVAGLSQLVESRHKLFLHANQSGVGRGYFSQAGAIACNDAMLEKIGLGHDLIEGVCVCSVAPDQDINYRKPSSKYGFEILEKYGKSTQDICYIGDNVADLLTAKNIGCLGVGVNTGPTTCGGPCLSKGRRTAFRCLTVFWMRQAMWSIAGERR